MWSGRKDWNNELLEGAKEANLERVRKAVSQGANVNFTKVLIPIIDSDF
jgi:hypothetical protein